MLEQEHGPGPEQRTITTKSRSKRQSKCYARSSARARGFAPEAEGWEGSKEDSSEGRRYIKRSGAAVVEAKQRIQFQKTPTQHLLILSHTNTASAPLVTARPDPKIQNNVIKL
jgi:hypothetical protein